MNFDDYPSFYLLATAACVYALKRETGIEGSLGVDCFPAFFDNSVSLL